MRDAFSDDAFGKMISNALRDERARRMLPSGFAEMVAADASAILHTARSKGGGVVRRIAVLAAAGVLVGGAYAAWSVSSSGSGTDGCEDASVPVEHSFSTKENKQMKNTILSATTAASVALSAYAVTTGGLADPAADFDVASGNVLVVGDKTGDDAILPESIMAKIAFWADGSKNVVRDSSGNMIAWLDVREEPVSGTDGYAARSEWNYPRAITYRSGDCPADFPLVKDDVASFGGKSYIDFGEYHDNRWLMLADASGARNRVSLTGYAGYLGFGATAGFVVGDVNDPDIAAYSAAGVRDNGTQYFHKGSGSSGDDAVFSLNNGCGRYGETRINGHIVNPTSNNSANRHVRNGWEIFLQNGPNMPNMFVSTFFNNGNFKAEVNASYTDRQGGGKIAEIMLFNAMLTQDEAAEVEAYLRQKWANGNTLGTVAIAGGAALSVTGDRATVVSDISGTGDVVKSGAGVLTVERNGRLSAGTLALKEGAVLTYEKRNHHMPLVAQGGKTVEVAASSLVASDGGNAGTFTLNGNAAGRRIALGGAESAVKKVVVSQSELILQPPAVPSADTATVEAPEFIAIGNLIVDGSFEEFDNLNNWTGSDLRANNSGAAMGVATKGSKSATDWTGNENPDEVPDGTRFAYIQVRNSINCTNGFYRTVTAPKAGLYRFSAWIRCRKRSYTDSTVKFCLAVDNTPILIRRTGRRGVWNAGTGTFTTTVTETRFQKICADIPLDTEPHKIQILAANTDNTTDTAANKLDRALLIDDIRLEPVAEGDFVMVRDAGFDTCTSWSEGEVNSSNGAMPSSSDNPFWSLAGTGGKAGYSRYPSTWFNNPAYADAGEDQCIYLQNPSGSSNSSTVSQDVTFSKSGRVRVSLRYANRSARLDTGAIRASGQTIAVSLGGAEIYSATVTSDDMTTAVAECDVAAGEQEFKISCTSDGNKDRSTVVDDIRIEYVSGDRRLVKDTSFADNSTLWTYDGATGGSDAFGTRELVFSGTASASQTLNVPEDGAYMLTFRTRGKPLEETYDASQATYGVHHNFQAYAHNVEVRLDGTLVGNVYNESAGRHVVEMRLPWMKAGSHVLKFGGSAQTVAEAQSRISGPVITPLATGNMPDWSGVSFALSDGATMNLDFEGSVRVNGLRVDGKSYVGILDASNAPFITGEGSVEVVPGGTVVIIK